MRTVKYYLGEVLNSGIPCANAIIRWEILSPCITLVCHLPDKVGLDGKKLTNGVEFSIDDDMENCAPCVKYSIECPGCVNCPIIDKDLCFCSGPEDCPPCHVCINGECIPICDNCDPVTGDCVECVNNEECPGDQICIQGDCQCPQGKYDPVSGKCVECIVGDINQNNPCLICLGGHWAAKICASGVVDPITCDCIGCVGNGDCGENQCCYGGECLCCKDSAIYDPISGKCVPKPPCGPDTPCPECFDCVNGQCVPRVCPEGYICVDGECRKECDCNVPTCNNTSACIPTAGGLCYCSPCSGPCASGADCGPGCYCDNGTCKPKPCVGACTSGADCGPGCGCLNGQCVPCNSINCATNPTMCAQILGCACNGNVCSKKVGCNDTPCVTSANCQQGCTCDKGICKDCANYSCDDCKNHPGCKCTNGLCGDDEEECNDKLTLTKIDASCDLKAELTLKEGCACSVLTFDSIANVSNNELSVLIQLRKGSGMTSPLLGDTTNPLIADNDKPTSGTVKLVVRSVIKFTNRTNPSSYYTEEGKSEFSRNFADADQVSVDSLSSIPINGEVPSMSTSTHIATIQSYKIWVEQTSDFVFANGCVYKTPKSIPFYSWTTNAARLVRNQVKVTTLKTTAKRNPLVSWYKSKDAIFDAADKFRSLYLPKLNGKYTDILLGLDQIAPKGKYPLVGQEGELWSGYNWMVTTDCGCVESASLNNVVFCNPKTVGFALNACHTGIKFSGPFAPCDVNQDIRPHRKAGYNIPDEAQVTYDLYINGVKFKSFVHNSQGNLMTVYDATLTGDARYTSVPMMSAQYFFTANDEEIKTAEIRQNNGTCIIPIAITPLVPRTIVDTINCAIVGNEYEIKVNSSQSGSTITNIIGANSFSLLSNIFTLKLNKGVSTEITFIFSDGCKTKKTYLECDCGVNPTASISSGNDFCSGQIGQITIEGTQGGTISYIEDGVAKTKVLGSPFIINTIVAKTVKLVSIQLDGCIGLIDQEVTVTPIAINDANAYILPDRFTICSGQPVTINIIGTVGVTAKLYVGGSGATGGIYIQDVIVPSSIVVFPPTTPQTNYYINDIFIGACNTNTHDNAIITVTPGPGELTWTSSCNGGIINRTFTFNQNVIFNGGTPTNIVTVPSNQGTFNVTYGSGTCTLTKTIPVSSCDCMMTVDVTASPQIICVGDSTTLSTNIFGGSAPYTYQWFRGGVLAGTGSTLTSSPATTSQYYVTVTDVQGCAVSNDPLTVTVNNPTNFGIIPIVATGTTDNNGTLLVCNNLTNITLIPSDPTVSVYWSLISGTYAGFPTGTSPAITLTVASITAPIVVQAIGTNQYGCVLTVTKQIIVQPCSCINQPTANAGPDLSSSGVTPVVLNGTVSNDINGLVWSTSGTGSFGNALLVDTTYTPSVADITAGTVTLTLTVADNDGSGPCTSATDSMVLTLTPATCCNGQIPYNSIDVSNPTTPYVGTYAMLTDLTIGNIDLVGACGVPAAYIWSNNTINPGDPSNLPPNAIPGTSANGIQEYFINNTSGCSSQIIADKEFLNPDGTRILLVTLADVAASANVRLASMASPYNAMFITVVGTVLKLNNAPYCMRLAGLARTGTVSVCGVNAAGTTLTNRNSTNFVPLNT